MAGGLWQFTVAFGHQKKLLVDIRTFLFVFAPFSCRILPWDKYNYCKEFAEFCILKQKLKMNKFLPFFMEAFTSLSCIIFLVSLIFHLPWLLLHYWYIYQYIFILVLLMFWLQGLVKLLGGKNPTLYSYEKSLPYLPVPDLDATMKRVEY